MKHTHTTVDQLIIQYLESGVFQLIILWPCCGPIPLSSSQRETSSGPRCAAHARGVSLSAVEDDQQDWTVTRHICGRDGTRDGGGGRGMDEWTIKTPNPKCRLFFKIDLWTEFAALCLTDFIDWRYIHSLVGIFDPACELLPPWTKELYSCTVAPLSSLWPPPLPSFLN